MLEGPAGRSTINGEESGGYDRGSWYGTIVCYPLDGAKVPFFRTLGVRHDFDSTSRVG